MQINNEGHEIPTPTNILLDNNISLSDIIVNRAEVVDQLSILNLNKAYGSDNISPKVLKLCREELADPLSNIFNNSLRSSTFLSKWKESHIIPIYKKGPPSEIGNYRPVALLSCISKVFEK
jgi:sarcosine oxidase/L-pipecolate oxidase